MPLRTRDFLLYLLSVGFLVVAIGVTIIRDVYPEEAGVASAIYAGASDGEVIYTATVEEKPAMDRAGHLVTLRNKIADFKDEITSSNKVAEPTPAPVEEIKDEELPEVLLTELKCPLYQMSVKEWSPKGLNLSVVEGARLLYREIEISNVTTSSSSSTSTPLLNKEVILQLPLQTYPAAEKSCLSSDVVGVALDGSLIKNNEYELYSIFGSETTIGYALDGFPIYGQSEVETDECGGVMVEGQYRYYLSSLREAVLYCYSGVPVEI